MCVYYLGNEIGDEGAKAIALSLEHNNTLTTLHLHRMYYQYNMLYKLINSCVYYLGNGIGVEGAKAIALSLEHNNALTTLNLYCMYY